MTRAKAKQLRQLIEQLAVTLADETDLSDFSVVDAVKVVRCGECKHRDNCNLMTDDDFCSDRERKEDTD